MFRNRFFLFMAISLVLALLVFGAGYAMVQYLASSIIPRSKAEFLYIERGDSLSRVARKAAEIGLVEKPWHFKLVTRWRGVDRRMFAGEYAVEPNVALADVLNTILNQQTYKRRFVVPEGASSRDVIRILENSFGIEMAKELPLPREGSLLPETYFYERGERATDLIERMQRQMVLVSTKLWQNRSFDTPLKTLEEAIILASIIEKETGQSDERSLVSAVFLNRLEKGMRLQSDPTVIYGIAHGAALGRPLSRADLRKDTPYNSYRRSGLPPTPIANPGHASIKAALNPADVSYIYFVADGSGGHAFAETLGEHNQNVARWRQLELKRE
jgi:UPF0755 protein